MVKLLFVILGLGLADGKAYTSSFSASAGRDFAMSGGAQVYKHIPTFSRRIQPFVEIFTTDVVRLQSVRMQL